ncbi:MAG: flagellar protein FliS [Firmicutes bacterium]|nr:flagellar protein FliS [Alicyclobacillaceae bacterium]MCL6497332.1 flagellar protein FliS [Bacillota bacterium]
MAGQEQLAYQAAQLMTQNPDYLGRELYRAALRDCHLMEEALRAKRWDQLVNAGSHAQQIFAGLHDITRQDTREGQVFRNFNRHLWQRINQVLQRHEEQPLQEVREALNEAIRQLDLRLSGEPSVAASGGGRLGDGWLG